VEEGVNVFVAVGVLDAVRVAVGGGGVPDSYAPISQLTPISRVIPRWSWLLIGAAAQTVASPASMAVLPVLSARFMVIPPLYAAAAKFGSPVNVVGHADVLVADCSTSEFVSVIVAPLLFLQSSLAEPAILIELATIEFLTVVTPPVFAANAVLSDLLCEIVTLIRVIVPQLVMPPSPLVAYSDWLS
jgi:hypothetical protein